MLPRPSPVSLALVAFLWTGVVQADPVAETLYQDGVERLKARDFDAACAKLKASFERERLSGTLMTLAQCEELRGNTATAWDFYKQAASFAQNEGRTSYEEKARELAEKLEPKLTRLEVLARSEVVVTVDGDTLEPATFGLALPMDPGSHEVKASAEGFEGWSTTVELTEEGATVRVEVPALTPLPEGASPDPGATNDSEPPASTDEGGIPAWAWVSGGLGVAALGVAGAFVALQIDANRDLDRLCDEDREKAECEANGPLEAEATQLFSDEKLYYGLYVGVGIVGVVGVVAGVTGIIMGASGDDEAAAWVPSLETDGRSARLTWRGRF